MRVLWLRHGTLREASGSLRVIDTAFEDPAADRLASRTGCTTGIPRAADRVPIFSDGRIAKDGVVDTMRERAVP